MATFKPKLINIVLDLETVSTQPNAGIVQIGACIPKFDQEFLPSDFPTTFDMTIRYEDVIKLCESDQFHMSEDTMKFWGEQPIETRRIVFSGQAYYFEVMNAFRDWVLQITQASGLDVAVWGNDVGFDNVILRHSLDYFGLHNVWSHKNNRCFRTLRALFPLTSLQEAKVKENTAHLFKHTGLGDAMYEATVMEVIVKAYGGPDGLERWML